MHANGRTSAFNKDEAAYIATEVARINEERSQNTLSTGEQALGLAAAVVAAVIVAIKQHHRY